MALLGRYGVRYRGWLANALAPTVFACHLATVHVPRRYYAEQLPGIPTIRVFEALACGIPLASAPWSDSEGLFTPGADYLVAKGRPYDDRASRGPARRCRVAAVSGLARPGDDSAPRHTCVHRADELLAITASLTQAVALQ